MTFYVLSPLPADQLYQQVRRVMSGSDGDLPLENLRKLQQHVRSNNRNDEKVLKVEASDGTVQTQRCQCSVPAPKEDQKAARDSKYAARTARQK